MIPALRSLILRWPRFRRRRRLGSCDRSMVGQARTGADGGSILFAPQDTFSIPWNSASSFIELRSQASVSGSCFDVCPSGQEPEASHQVISRRKPPDGNVLVAISHLVDSPGGEQ